MNYRRILFFVIIFVLVMLLTIFGFQFTSQPGSTRSVNCDSLTATSGSLFKGEKVRKFEGKRIMSTEQTWSKSQNSWNLNILLVNASCTSWSVVTTIFPSSEVMKTQARLKGWCIVIVGDEKGPPHEPLFDESPRTIFYLSADLQKTFTTIPFVNKLKWNHFSRKNLGYLFAIVNGAQEIWDFDDDNLLLNPEQFVTPLPKTIKASRAYGHDKGCFNPYPYFFSGENYTQSDIIWPRGFPLNQIVNNTKSLPLSIMEIPSKSISIYQSVANNDPDVDAIYRLTRKLPVTFSPTELTLLIPPNGMSPFNAQATRFIKPAFWMLYLPISVHGRVSDIWRSYFGQTISRLFGLEIAFTEPKVVQYRNTHNYLADFNSEIPLYEKSGALVSFLMEFIQDHKFKTELTLPKVLEDLWIEVYERDYIEIIDIHTIQLWLQTLMYIKYDFPQMTTTRGSRSNPSE